MTILLRSNNIKAMECSRCGKCCFEPFNRNVRTEDLTDWEKRGRPDIVETFRREEKKSNHVNPDMAALGMAFHSCMFLRSESPGRFYCEIYEFRPATCRQFGVGCSKLCPNYQGGKRS